MLENVLAMDAYQRLLGESPLVDLPPEFGLQEQRVTSLQLWVDYQKNPAAADERFEGQLLLVSGPVLAIDSGYSTVEAKYYVRLPGALAQLSARERMFVARLRIGQPITLACRFPTRRPDHVLIGSCSSLVRAAHDAGMVNRVRLVGMDAEAPLEKRAAQDKMLQDARALVGLDSTCFSRVDLEACMADFEREAARRPAVSRGNW